MRQIVLDTETTGLSPQNGHRIIEIGCVELIDRRLTDNNLHLYINPQRDIDAGAMNVHGISNEFLTDKPLFSDLCEQIMDYLCDAELIIHNAPFDVGFLDHELQHLPNSKWQPLSHYCTIFDSLSFARKKHPGQRNSLDSLCKRYDINNTHRVLHGALLDAQILSQVYLLMTGGQKSMSFEQGDSQENSTTPNKRVAKKCFTGNIKKVQATEEEHKAHVEYIASLAKTSGKKIAWD